MRGSRPEQADTVRELPESARLAPSGCDAQPWRFKVVTEPAVRRHLADAAYRYSSSKYGIQGVDMTSKKNMFLPGIKFHF